MIIENIPDALQTVVDAIQKEYTSGTGITEAGEDYYIQIFSEFEPELKVGMYVEFLNIEGLENSRFEIVDLTYNSRVRICGLLFNDKRLKDYLLIPDTVLRLFLVYDYGHPKEIQANIEETFSNKTNQFPALYLFLEYDETRGQNNKYLMETSVNLAICIDTFQNWKASDRLESSFKQVLYPLYNLFIEKLRESELFLQDEFNLIQHNKQDAYFWSATEAKEQNSLAKIVDAIDIRNLELIITNNQNCN